MQMNLGHQLCENSMKLRKSCYLLIKVVKFVRTMVLKNVVDTMN